MTVGGMRGRLGDSGPSTWAEHVFATDVIGAADVASGWVFLTRDGVLWQAETFTGAVTRLRRWDIAHSLAGSGRGAIVTGRGEVFATDGRELEPVVLPDGEQAGAAAFVDARTLVVVSTRERAWIRRDDTWSALPVDTDSNREHPSTWVELGPSGARVEAGFDDALVPWPSGLPPRFVVAQRVDDRLARATSEAHGERAASRPVGLGDDCVELEPRFYVCRELRGGRNVRPRLHVVDANGTAHVVGGAPPRGAEEMRLAVDASLLVGLGTHCGRATRTDDAESLAVCTVDARSGRQSNVSLPDTVEDHFVGASAGRALFLGSVGDTTLRIVEGANVRVVPLPSDPNMPDPILRDRQVLPGGLASASVVSSLSDRPARVLGLLVALDLGTARLVTLPEGAMAFGALDANRAIAAGATLAELWVTSDGGNAWQVLRPAMTGNAAQVPLAALDAHLCRAALATDHPRLRSTRERLFTVADRYECDGVFEDAGIWCDSTGCDIHERFRVGLDASASGTFVVHAAD